MTKFLAVSGALLLSVSVSAAALAGGAGYTKKEQPQADPVPNSDSNYGAPGGHGGGGFGKSDRTNGTNGDVSGINGNQGKDPSMKNDDRGNAGPGEVDPEP